MQPITPTMTYTTGKKKILPHCKVRDLDYKPFEMENKGAVMDQEKGISKNLSA